MKKVLIISLVLVLLVSNVGFAEGLSDIDNHWAKEYIQKLIYKEIIIGYPDGTFKADNNVTIAEAIKLLVTATGNNITISEEGFWADSYIKESITRGYILESEFEDFNKPITRGELARIIVRAINEEYANNINEYSNQIIDYKDISSIDKEFVLKAYTKGIIQGYPDKTFKANNNVTRAEASTMLIKYLEPNNRIVPELDKVEKPIEEIKNKFIEPDFKTFYYTGSLDSYEYFGIQLNNYDEFKNREDYIFKTECISHPEINKVSWRELDGRFLNKVSDRIERFTMKGTDITGDGQIYGLWQFYRWKPLNSNTHFAIKDGQMMRYKVTVTNDKESKEYFLDIEFRNKEFRFNNI